MAACPECDAEIEVDEFDVDLGDPLSCPECGQSLVVSSTNPIELDLAVEENDDEDESDDELDEDGDDDSEDEDGDDEDEDWEE
jgi:alpha-aminoadipate/glutamate carrier protein LysW